MRNVHICMLQFLPIGNYSMKYYLIHVITENVEKSLLCDSLHDKKKTKIYVYSIYSTDNFYFFYISYHSEHSFESQV